MNYGQFLNMVPEYYLVLILLAVFVVDFIMHRSEKKCDVLFAVTAALLVVLPVRIVMLADPAEAFGGLYVATPAVTVMKAILAFGTLIVVLMAQPWVATRKQLAGEFYMLLLSTLLGMFVMMSSGNFLMFFLGLEMASVPLACMVAFDKDRKNSAEGAAKYILVATFSSGLVRSISTTWLQPSRPLRWPSWVSCSSSVVWASRSLSCPSTSGQPTPIRERPRQSLVTSVSSPRVPPPSRCASS